MAENRTSNFESAVALAMFAALGLAGFWLGFNAVKDFARARASLSWPPIEGVVLSKDAEDSADIRYAYVAGGHGHESRRVRFLTGLFYAAPTDRLRPGEGVTIYVDPHAPNVAVLRPGGSGLVFAAAALVAGAFAFFGLGGVIRTLMKAGRRRDASGQAPAPEPASETMT